MRTPWLGDRADLARELEMAEAAVIRRLQELGCTDMNAAFSVAATGTETGGRVESLMLDALHLRRLRDEIWGPRSGEATRQARLELTRLTRSTGGTARRNQRRAEWSDWQTIVNQSGRLFATKTDAARHVRHVLESVRKVPKGNLPALSTIVKHIALKKKSRRVAS